MNKVNKAVKIHSVGKTVYWVNGQSFENSKGCRDGKDKAVAYCLDNFLDPNTAIHKFDSRTERDRYEYLLSLQEQGLISNLSHHFLILVQEAFTNANGDSIPPITYEADFIYKEGDKRIVEDVKGSEYFLDERFITIKQVFDKMKVDKGLYIRVIMFRNGQWVEWHIGDAKKSGKLIKKQREEIKALRKEKHDKEIAERLATKEKTRMNELKTKLATNGKLRSDERKRLAALEAKYGK